MPRSKIWRAFPELDRFSDEQCTRFVKAACRRGWMRFGNRAELVGLFVVLFPAFLWSAAGLFYILDEVSQSNVLVLGLIGFPMTVAVCTMPVLIVMMLRDRMLRKRITHVLRARGTCPSCRYSLLGIVVGADNLVICPECGMEVEVDKSLNELVTDAQGRSLFMPSEQVDGFRFWTPKRKKLARRLAIGLGVLVFVVGPAAWGGYELFLHRQAKTAKAERIGAAGATAFVESSQPAGTSKNDADAYDVLESIFGEQYTITDEISNRPEYLDTETGNPLWVNFSAIYDPLPEYDDSPEQANQTQQQHKLALALLEAYGEAGLFEKLDSLASVRRAVRPISLGADQPLVEVALPDLGKIRELARINAARMQLAFESGDHNAFLGALESNLALSRFVQHQFTLIDSLVGIAIDALTYERVLTVLASHPDEAWLDGIEAAYAHQRVALPRNHAIEGERLFILDTAAWFFSDPDRTRFGRFSPELASFIGGLEAYQYKMRLGTYAQNRDTLNAYFDRASEAAMHDPVARSAFQPYQGTLVFVDIFDPNIDGYLKPVDIHIARQRALPVLIALERSRLAHGAYPEKLDALVPAYLKSLPVDPWTGKSFVYRLAPDAGVGFVLYSVGPDGDDNGGVVDMSHTTRQNQPADLVLSPLEDQ